MDFKTMGAIAGLLKNKDKLAETGERIKATLDALEVSAEAGGGAIRVTASGTMRVRDVHLEPAVVAGMNADDATRQMVQSLIAEATNAALEKAQAEAQRIVAAEAQDLGVPGIEKMLGGMLP